MINLLIVLLILIAIIVLQIFLSRMTSKIPGLILPALAFLASLIFPLNMTAAAGVLGILIVWLVGNVPTIIFLLIYVVCREKFRKKNELEKMKIQDLE